MNKTIQANIDTAMFVVGSGSTCAPIRVTDMKIFTNIISLLSFLYADWGGKALKECDRRDKAVVFHEYLGYRYGGWKIYVVIPDSMDTLSKKITKVALQKAWLKYKEEVLCPE